MKKGSHYTPEQLERITAANQSKEHRESISNAKKKQWANPKFREKMEAIFADEEYREKLSDVGKATWEDQDIRNRRLDGMQSEESREKLRIAHTGMKMPERTKEHRQKISDGAKERYKDSDYKERWLLAAQSEDAKRKRVESWQQYRIEHPEEAENWLKNVFRGNQVSPNKPELELLEILNVLQPDEWQYCGNGDLMLGSKNPDFVNTGKDKLVEMFGDYWHENDTEEKIIKRTKLFEQFGFELLIIWESELKDTSTLMEKLQNWLKSPIAD